MTNSKTKILLKKSITSAISAIEIYNKPNFLYREETFSILMVNSWELLMKAKVLSENDNKASSIYEYEKKTGKDINKPRAYSIKLNRAGNPVTISLFKAISKLENDHKVKLESSCKENISLLQEIRDNSIHFRNKESALNKKVQEIGTANLKNYLALIRDWFDYDLSEYNFYLMPLSFFTDFSTMETIPLTKHSKEAKMLLMYINEKEKIYKSNPSNRYNLTLKLKTQFIKSSDTDALLVKYSTDPNALSIKLSEESIRERFPWDYTRLIAEMAKRYSDFVANPKWHKIRTNIKERSRDKFWKPRYLDPDKEKGTKKDFYNPNIFNEFDKYYKKK